MHKYLLIWSILTFFASCSSHNRELKATDRNLNNVLPTTIENNRLLTFENGSVLKMEFTDFQKARAYAMERRLLILRKFEIMVEPYFGTANAKNCHDNLSSSHLKTDSNTFSALLQLPVTGSQKVIHDCLEENNTDWANIELLVCGKNFYDIRLYQPIKSKPKYEAKFQCGN